MTRLPRHKRMTEEYKQRKVAKQFQRRVDAQRSAHGRMRFALGVKDYWALYEQRLADQEGKCAICGTDKPGGRGRWHLDHNKRTGKVRGLLCCNCNLKLGWTETNWSNIVNYLRKWS